MLGRILQRRRPDDIARSTDLFVLALEDVGERLDGVDFEWLRSAGLPESLLTTLASLVDGTIGQKEVAIAVLYLVMSQAAGDRFDRGTSRRVRAWFKQMKKVTGSNSDDLMRALVAILHNDADWEAFVRG